MKKLQELPLSFDIETTAILKKVAEAERALGELKGVIQKVPNGAIVLETLSLQESKSSSEIENIVTTDDEIYKGQIGLDVNSYVKEVQSYNKALHKGFKLVQEEGLLTNNYIIEIQNIIKNTTTGFRMQSGTTLKDNGGEVIYTPPQGSQEIIDLMSNLEKFINDDSISDLNPLVKMAMIHYQFEAIHPFGDGNGRTGRIINILYLVLKKRLDVPVLYLSHYIINTKADYYRLLREITQKGNWGAWILYILDGVIQTSYETIKLINAIHNLSLDYKRKIRDKYPKMYSQDLINNLFKCPYTKIVSLMEDLKVTRITATRYLDRLAEGGFLKKEKWGRENYYINPPLVELFINN